MPYFTKNRFEMKKEKISMKFNIFKANFPFEIKNNLGKFYESARRYLKDLI